MKTSEEREQVFILLFEKSFNPEFSADDIIKIAVGDEIITETAYTKELFLSTVEKIDEIDSQISKYSKERSFDRISKVSLALLRLAVCEIRYFDKVPVGVSINEAVNLCKKYGSEDEYSFVNGILGSIAREEIK
jgi:N utilization substance protein B